MLGKLGVEVVKKNFLEAVNGNMRMDCTRAGYFRKTKEKNAMNGTSGKNPKGRNCVALAPFVRRSIPEDCTNKACDLRTAASSATSRD